MNLDIKKNELHDYVDLLRGKEWSETGNSLYNVIRTMRSSRHDKVCGEDFSQLDFGNIPFNGIHFSLNGEYPCDFSKCKLNEWNFINGHNCKIEKIIFAGELFVSADHDGNIIGWDVTSGLMRYKINTGYGFQHLICTDNKLIRVGIEGKVTAWNIHTGDELYHFYLNPIVKAVGVFESCGYVVFYLGDYYKLDEIQKSKFFVFDKKSGKIISEAVETDNLKVEKIVVHPNGWVIASSQHKVVAFNVLIDKELRTILEYPKYPFNKILDMRFTVDGYSVLILVQGHQRACEMLYTDDYKPYALHYHALIDTFQSYCKAPYDKPGWIDWGDDDGFGIDFDGAWCFIDEDGHNMVCNSNDNFVNVFISSDGENYIIEYINGIYKIFDSRDQRLVQTLSINEIKTYLKNGTHSYGNKDIAGVFKRFPSFYKSVLTKYTELYPYELMVSKDGRDVLSICYCGKTMLIDSNGFRELQHVRFNQCDIHAVSDDLSFMVTGDDEGKLSVYNVYEDRKMYEIQGSYGTFSKETYELSGFYYKYHNNHLLVWDKNQQFRYTHCFSDKIISSEIIAYNNYCVFVTRDNKICLWDIIHGSLIEEYSYDYEITSFVIIGKKNRIIFALQNGQCVLIDFFNKTKIENQYPIRFYERVIVEIVPTSDAELCLLSNEDIRLVCWDIENNIMHLLPAHTTYIDRISVRGGQCSGNRKKFYNINDYITNEREKWEWLSESESIQQIARDIKLYPIRNVEVKNCDFSSIEASIAVKEMLYQQMARIDQSDALGQLSYRCLNEVECDEIKRYVLSAILQNSLESNAIDFAEFTLMYNKLKYIEFSLEDIDRIKNSMKSNSYNFLIELLMNYNS